MEDFFQTILMPFLKPITWQDGWALSTLVLVAIIMKFLPYRYPKALGNDGSFRFLTWIGRIGTFIFAYNLGAYAWFNDWTTGTTTQSGFFSSMIGSPLESITWNNGWAVTTLLLAAVICKFLPYRYSKTLGKAYQPLTYVGRVGVFIFAYNLGTFAAARDWIDLILTP